MITFLFVMYPSSYASTVTRFDKETIKQLITTHIEKNMPWPEGTVRIEFSSRIPDITICGKDITCRVQNRRNEDFIGYSTFAVRFYSKRVFLKEETVRVRLEVLKHVVVSSRFLSRGDEISCDDVRVVRKWFDRIPPNVVTDLKEVVGKRLCTSIKQNTEIARNMLREPLMVKRGKQVRIMLEKGPLKVTTIGMSKQDGGFGDFIRVENVSSKKVIYARVTGDSVVCVDY